MDCAVFAVRGGKVGLNGNQIKQHCFLLFRKLHTRLARVIRICNYATYEIDQEIPATPMPMMFDLASAF